MSYCSSTFQQPTVSVSEYLQSEYYKISVGNFCVHKAKEQIEITDRITQFPRDISVVSYCGSRSHNTHSLCLNFLPVAAEDGFSGVPM